MRHPTNRYPANKAGCFWALFLSLCLSLPSPALALRVQNGGLEERTPTIRAIEDALLSGNSQDSATTGGLEETLAAALGRPEQPVSQEAERERVLREVWEEVIERGWLYHGTSLNNLESIRTWGLDADHKPFDTQEIDAFFRLHQKYFNLQDPYKSTRQNEIISLSYDRSLAEDFSAKPPEIIDILLRESERMIAETNPGSLSNRISDSERQWLIRLHAKYAAWAETHQPLVVAIPLEEGITRALLYRGHRDLLLNYRMSAETLYRADPLFAFLDFNVFKVMAKQRFKKFERTGFEKIDLARQLQSDLHSVLRDVEVSRVGGPSSGSRLSVSPSPDVFVPISEYAPVSAGLEEPVLETHRASFAIKQADFNGIQGGILVVNGQNRYFRSIDGRFSRINLETGVRLEPLPDKDLLTYLLLALSEITGEVMARHPSQATLQGVAERGYVFANPLVEVTLEYTPTSVLVSINGDKAYRINRNEATDVTSLRGAVLDNSIKGMVLIIAMGSIVLDDALRPLLQGLDMDTRQFFAKSPSEYHAGGLEESREAAVQQIWDRVRGLGTLDEIRSMSLETFAGKVGVKVIERAGIGRPIFTLSEQFYKNLVVLRKTGRLPSGVAATSYAPLADNTAIDGPGIYLATKDLETLRQAIRQSGELMEYNKGTFIHELLEEAFAQAGVMDPVLHLFRQHTDPEVIEEEMLFNGLMGPQDVRQAAEIYRGMKERVEDILLSRPEDYFPTIQKQYRALRGEIAVEQIAQSLGPQSPYYRTLGWALETPPDKLEELAKQRWQGASFKSFVQSAGMEEDQSALQTARDRLSDQVIQPQRDTLMLLRKSDRITNVTREYLPGLVVEMQEAGLPEGMLLLMPANPLASASLDSPLVTVYVHPGSEGAATVKEILAAGLGYWLRFETDPTKARILIGDENFKNSVESTLRSREQTFLVVNAKTAGSVTVNLLGSLHAEGYLTAGRVFYLYTDLEDATALFA